MEAGVHVSFFVIHCASPSKALNPFASDYKGLKKRITACRREQSSARDRSGSSDEESEHHASSDPLTDTEPLEHAENTRLPPLPHSGDIIGDADDEGVPSGTTVHGDSGSEDGVKVDHSVSPHPEVNCFESLSCRLS